MIYRVGKVVRSSRRPLNICTYYTNHSTWAEKCLAQQARVQETLKEDDQKNCQQISEEKQMQAFCERKHSSLNIQVWN